MHFAPPIEIGPLDDDARHAVRSLAEETAAHDGVAPLSEQPLLNLAADEEWLTHVVARNPYGKTVGYAQVDRSGETASAELFVHPDHRGRGTGRLLLRTAERDATIPARSGVPGQHGKPLRVWAHGDLPVARSFADRAGYNPVRELLFLARPLGPGDATPSGTTPPSGLRVRTFVPGRDEEAWLRVNARAFASHPEQGRLTLQDLRAREAEPWFDPEGFFLLVADTPDDAPDGDLAGFLWTKVERDQPDGARDGEIYAVGVDPGHQGRGLGGYLTATGLAHLARVGATRAVLYVEGDNSPALATYARAGFERAGTHVQYART